VPFNYSLAEDATLDLMDRMPDVYDEPIADISILPTWLVSHEAAKNVKAVMSGEGADELLGGYWWQKKMFAMSNPESWKEQLSRFFRGDTTDRVEFYADAMAMGRFDRAELERAFQPDLHGSLPADPDWFYRQHFDASLTPFKSIQRLDIKCFMGELVLTKMDRASMASSLEVRVPFLDHEIFESVLCSREKTYFRPDVTKFLLYENIRDHLPDEILNRPKQGFVGPNDFYTNLDRYRKILEGGRLTTDGIIRPEYLEELFVAQDHWRLWKFAVLENWYKRWVH
jgi:asparagine synthase (glutamine-hydrolysing)